MSDLIVVPARYGSTRFPGKPLHRIAGRMLVERVASAAVAAAALLGDVDGVVGTDDERIATAVIALGLTAIRADPSIASGSDRALAAIRKIGATPAHVVNLQGDAPFIRPEHIAAILRTARQNDADITTPVVQLSWDHLDALRARKSASPASGTTCIRHADGRAIWFSKAVLPFIRNERALRGVAPLSPVFLHLGLYCFRLHALEAFAAAPPGAYEQLEGLEQLRALERGMRIDTVVVEADSYTSSGIDTLADAEWAEQIIARHGDPFADWRRA
jgi:3-deoxy-manno-octulosonate cytidylyltransferase (CMP-KDO synthetase)